MNSTRPNKRTGSWKPIFSNDTSLRSNSTTLTSLALVWVLAAWIYGATGEPLLAESPWRLVVGASCILLMPGLIWGEILGYRSRHALETVALSFSLTLVIEIVFLAAAFWLHKTMDFFVSAVLAANLVGLGFLALKVSADERFRFISPAAHTTPGGRLEGFVTLACLVVLSAFTYRSGEALWATAGEKMLQFIWVRHYFELPLDLDAIGALRGQVLPNLVHLWEFLIAATARISSIDPAYAFVRIRFVLPIIGFAGLYLLIRNVFRTSSTTRAVFWYLLLLCVSGFAFIEPSNVRWAAIEDSTRGVLHFMGSVHHSDAAMAILLGLVSGLLLTAYRRPNTRNMVLVLGVVLASFLWHPREFFQTGVYWGIFLLLAIGFALHQGGNVTGVVRRWSLVTGAYFLVVVGYLTWSAVLVPELSHSHDEMGLKLAALRYAIHPESLLGFRSLFHMPSALYLDNMTHGEVLSMDQLLRRIDSQWNFSFWLILSALSIPVLALFGGRRERQLGMYYVLLWVLALCWNFSLLVIMALTYSEFFMSTQRLLYMFAFIVVSTAVYTLSRVLSQRADSIGGAPVFLTLMLFIGSVVHVASRVDWPWQQFFSGLITAIVVLSILYAHLNAAPHSQRRAGVRGNSKVRSTPVCFIGGLLLLAPMLHDGYVEGIPKLFSRARPPVDWMGERNPFALSPAAVERIRGLPALSMVLADPFDDVLLQIYAPVYTVAVPKKISAVIPFKEFYQSIEDGENPVFRSGSHRDDPSHQEITEWLNSYGVDYVLARDDHYTRLAPYFVAHPSDYGVLHESTQHREILVIYRSNPHKDVSKLSSH